MFLLHLKSFDSVEVALQVALVLFRLQTGACGLLKVLLNMLYIYENFCNRHQYTQRVFR
jgi:hypothetical protein